MGINNSGDIFIGLYWPGRLYRSTDQGKNWVQLKNGFPEDNNNNINVITIKSSGEIFVGTAGDGIFLSTDNGNSWKQANNGLSNLVISDISIKSTG